MIGLTHAAVPYELFLEHSRFLRDRGLSPEIFFSSGNLDSITKGALEELKRVLSYSNSMSIHAPYMDMSPGAVDSKVREVTRRRFAQIMDIAEHLGPRAVVFHSGYEKWRYGHKIDAWLDGSIRMWTEFVERAARIGTKIAIENVFEDRPGSLRLLMERIDSEHFGICLDTGHLNLFSKEPLSRWLDALGQYIVELHIHDNDRGFDSHLAIGDGNFDFDELFGRLDKKGLIYTVEAHDPGDLDKSLFRLNRYIYKREA